MLGTFVNSRLLERVKISGQPEKNLETVIWVTKQSAGNSKEEPQRLHVKHPVRRVKI